MSIYLVSTLCLTLGRPERVTHSPYSQEILGSEFSCDWCHNGVFTWCTGDTEERITNSFRGDQMFTLNFEEWPGIHQAKALILEKHVVLRKLQAFHFYMNIVGHHWKKNICYNLLQSRYQVLTKHFINIIPINLHNNL